MFQLPLSTNSSQPKQPTSSSSIITNSTLFILLSSTKHIELLKIPLLMHQQEERTTMILYPLACTLSVKEEALLVYVITAKKVVVLKSSVSQLSLRVAGECLHGLSDPEIVGVGETLYLFSRNAFYKLVEDKEDGVRVVSLGIPSFSYLPFFSKITCYSLSSYNHMDVLCYVRNRKAHVYNLHPNPNRIKIVPINSTKAHLSLNNLLVLEDTRVAVYNTTNTVIQLNMSIGKEARSMFYDGDTLLISTKGSSPAVYVDGYLFDTQCSVSCCYLFNGCFIGVSSRYLYFLPFDCDFDMKLSESERVLIESVYTAMCNGGEVGVGGEEGEGEGVGCEGVDGVDVGEGENGGEEGDRKAGEGEGDSKAGEGEGDTKSDAHADTDTRAHSSTNNTSSTLNTPSTINTKYLHTSLLNYTGRTFTIHHNQPDTPITSHILALLIFKATKIEINKLLCNTLASLKSNYNHPTLCTLTLLYELSMFDSKAYKSMLNQKVSIQQVYSQITCLFDASFFGTSLLLRMLSGCYRHIRSEKVVVRLMGDSEVNVYWYLKGVNMYYEGDEGCLEVLGRCWGKAGSRAVSFMVKEDCLKGVLFLLDRYLFSDGTMDGVRGGVRGGVDAGVDGAQGSVRGVIGAQGSVQGRVQGSEQGRIQGRVQHSNTTPNTPTHNTPNTHCSLGVAACEEAFFFLLTKKANIKYLIAVWKGTTKKHKKIQHIVKYAQHNYALLKGLTSREVYRRVIAECEALQGSRALSAVDSALLLFSELPLCDTARLYYMRYRVSGREEDLLRAKEGVRDRVFVFNRCFVGKESFYEGKGVSDYRRMLIVNQRKLKEMKSGCVWTHVLYAEKYGEYAEYVDKLKEAEKYYYM